VCRLTASGLETSSFHVTGIASAMIEAMLPVANKLGLEMVTGEDWIILTGARSRLGAFARPWVQPDAVRDLAHAIGMAMPADLPMQWRHARGTLSLETPLLMGILNVTPDSFSDGGQAVTEAAILQRIEILRAGGAAVIDVGGESTAPGAPPVALDEELARVIPAIAAAVRAYPDLVISVDTVKHEVAKAALDAGAAIVNDVTAGRHDPELLTVASAHGAGVVLSHSRGEVGRLASYDAAEYSGDVQGGVTRELDAARAGALAAGIRMEQIVLDPGFGFAKHPAQNIALLDQVGALVALGSPVLIGASRKRFLGEVSGRPLEDRDRATAAACALALDRGARLFRVHDPEATRDALAVAEALWQSRK
jgi:dihydropteroate synthase